MGVVCLNHDVNPALVFAASTSTRRFAVIF